MNFTVACSIFARLSVVALQSDEEDYYEPAYEAIRCVRLERRNGKSYAMATNRNVFAIEYLGETSDPDGSVNVSLDLVEPCREGIKHDANLLISVLDVSTGWAVGTTTHGYFHPGSASVSGGFPDWPNLIPSATPIKPVGAIAFIPIELELLAKASPSGAIVMPRYYDVAQPLVVRDILDPNWMGLFLSLEHAKQSFGPASVPDWVK